MSNNDPDDESADSQQESEQQQPADSDQSVAQSDGQPTEQTDQSSEQPGDQAADSDQVTQESEEQPAEGDQAVAQAEGSPSDSDRSTEQSEEAADTDGAVAQAQAETTQTQQQSKPGGQPPGQAKQGTTQTAAPKRPYDVESWRPLVTEAAGDIPVEVLLRWIKRESRGNPCATGAPAKTGGGSIENGLFQLYSPDNDHLATPAQLHGSFCSDQTSTRDLTLDEASLQVRSGIALVSSCRERARAQLKQAGVTWDEAGTDFWSLVKFQHNLPAIATAYVPKLRPSSWSDFKQGVLKDHPDYGTYFSNAEDIGSAAV